MNFEFVFALFTLIITVQSDMKDTSEKGSRVTWRREPPFEEWVIEIEGGVRKAKMAARSMGLNYVSPVLGFDNMYVLHSKYKSRTSEEKVGRRIRRSPLVLWAQKQVPLVRAKRSTSSEFHWNDPLYPEMWYIHRASQGQGYDMNVLEAWGLGYTGKGVVVTIMDDGIDYTHPDLVANYDPWASYDMNDNDRDPMPNLKNPDNNRHGTRCAGQIAAQGNNSVCVVGIAYNAKIGGIRMLDGYITDRVEAQTLKFNQSYIDIYSGSWGPEDTGKLYEGPGALARKAFHSGILNGRKGFGNIYVWASGNGGSMGDSCACDGYASSPYTLSVSGVGERNSRPWYLEKCSSTLVTTYSSGTPAEKMIAATRSTAVSVS
ncbi:unnamed protein product [Calicophoron daubneyi]|uniref:Uncharacterized protein n=1 Tax=Calicophoron daubneyi TaxID=300641 RepID=A0AAV2TWE4_CALDB